MDSEQIVHDVAERVREIVSEAETRAAEIVRGAEADAKRIRERAEEEGRSRLEDMRRALEELQGRLGVGDPDDATGAKPASSEVEPGPVVVPEPQPPAIPEPEPPPPEPAPDPPPEPEPPLIPEPTPPPDEATPPTAANGAEKSDDGAGARLVALNMALEGASREEIERKLDQDYALADRATLLDEVIALTGK